MNWGDGGSVVILLLIGFVVGVAGTWFIFWRREKRRMRLEFEYRSRWPGQVKAESPDVGPLVLSAAHPPAPLPAGQLLAAETKLPQTAAALAAGPLALGAGEAAGVPALAAVPPPAASTTAAVPALPAKQPPPLRTTSGNPFAAGGVEPYNVVTNPAVAASLEATPVSGGPLARAATGFARGSSGLELAPGALPSAPPAVAASYDAAQHARSDTVVVNVNPLRMSGASDVAPISAVARSASLDRQQAAPAPTPDYMAAVARSSAAAPAAAAAAPVPPAQDKQAQKQELLQAVAHEEYDEGDLDPEWQELLAELDARLRRAGKPAMSARERAVAIRSLIVATASQSADVALDKAVQDVEVYRRAQAFRTGA